MNRHVPVSPRMKNFFRVSRTLLLSSSPVILIVLCVAIMLSSNSLNLIHREAERANQQNLSNISSEVESIFFYANDLNSRLSTKKDIVDYVSSPTRNYYQEYYISHNLLNDSMLDGRYAISSMLYLEEYDYILGKNWGAERATCLSEQESETFMRIIDAANTAGTRYFPSFNAFYADENDFMPQLVFSRAVRSSKGDGYVITEIDSASLAANIRNMLWDNRSHFIIYSNQGVLLSTLPDDATKALSEALPGQPDSFEWNNQHYSLSYNASASSPLNYVLLSSLAASSTRLARVFSTITIILILIIAVFLVFYVTWLNYKPLQRTMQKIGVRPNSGVTEYQAIENTVRSYIERNYALNRQIKESENDLRNLYMEKLLEGRVAHMENISESLSLYNIDLPYPYLMVTVFQATENISFLSGEDSGEENGADSKTEMLRSLVIGALERRRIHVRIYSLEINDSSVFVFNGGKEELSVIRNVVADQISKAAQDWLHSECAFSSSHIHETVEKLPDAYREALHLALRSDTDKEDAPNKPSESSAMKDLSARCQAIIHEYYSDSDFSVASIADRLKVSPSYLSRVFKQQVGMGILEYIHRYRVRAVRKILNENPHLPLEEVARQTGFYNLPALIRVFKKVEGVTPGQYRSRHEGNPPSSDES